MRTSLYAAPGSYGFSMMVTYRPKVGEGRNRHVAARARSASAMASFVNTTPGQIGTRARMKSCGVDLFPLTRTCPHRARRAGGAGAAAWEAETRTRISPVANGRFNTHHLLPRRAIPDAGSLG